MFEDSWISFNVHGKGRGDILFWALNTGGWYFILGRRGETGCYFNLGGVGDLIGRWGCKQLPHTFITVRICHCVNNCWFKAFLQHSLVTMNLYERELPERCTCMAPAGEIWLTFLALLMIVSQSFSDWGTNYVCSSVYLSRLSYLKSMCWNLV